MEITSLSQLDLNKSYTYADYLTWQFKERVELLRGKIFKMSPAPASNHQRIVRKISTSIDIFLSGKSCELFFAPFDVRLQKQSDDKSVTTIVQPDICVICDPKKIDKRGCNGAPELVIEILSPGNSEKEMGIKYELYEANGVLEYWLIDPEHEVVFIYRLKDGKFYAGKPYSTLEVIQSDVLVGFEMNVSKIFGK